MSQPKGMPPGVYVGLSMDEYHADPAIGSSGIKDLIGDASTPEGTPLKYWWNSALNPDRQKRFEGAAQMFGTAYHTLILEPEIFDKLYEVKRGTDKSSVPGMIGEGDYNRAMTMRGMLFSVNRYRHLMTEGVSECSIFWRDEETGLMCKIRCDKFAPGWIADLKTDMDVSSGALFYSFVDNGYDVSGAMYSIGAQALKKMIRAGYPMPRQFSKQFVDEFMSHDEQLFAFMYQNKEAPYTPRLWVVTPWLAEIGKLKMRKGLFIYTQHQDNEGMWPSGYPEVEDITEDMLSQKINY